MRRAMRVIDRDECCALITVTSLQSLMTSQIISKKTLHEAKWIALKEITYKDPKGIERKWDTAERTTRKGDVDGVEILAIISAKDKPDHVVVVSQFRPPIGKHVLEFPAGLIDEGESIEQAALRELQEECGYDKGVTVVGTSPIAVLEPGMSNANGVMVHIKIDGDAAGHIAPKQQLMEDEFIEVMLFPLNTLHASLTEYQKQHDCTIDCKLYSFSYGLLLSNKPS